MNRYCESDRAFCGLRVACRPDQQDLAHWDGDDKPADVVIALGAVPRTLPDARRLGPLLQIAEDGRCRFELPGIAAFLIEGGTSITVEPQADAPGRDVRTILLGTPLFLLVCQRGLLPLNASCVVVNGRAVALTGDGKSTLAAAFLRRGHAVIGDDFTVLDLSTSDGVRVLPGVPRLSLWQESLGPLGWPVVEERRVRTGLRRYAVPVPATPDSVPLSNIFTLSWAAASRHIGSQFLSGVTAINAIGASIPFGLAMQVLVGPDRLFRCQARIAAEATVCRFGVTWDLGALDDLVSRVTEAVAR